MLRAARRSRGQAEGRRLGARLSVHRRLGRGRRRPHRRLEPEARGQGFGAQEQVGPVLRIVRVRPAKLAGVLAAFSACASTTAAEKTIEPPTAADSAFVLSRDPAPARKAEPADLGQVHVGDLWWPFRGSYLKVPE